MEEITINDAYLKKLGITVKFPADAREFDSTGHDNEDEDDSSANQMGENKINYQADMAKFLSSVTGLNFTIGNSSGYKGKFKVIDVYDQKSYVQGNIPPREFSGYNKLRSFLLTRLNYTDYTDKILGNTIFTMEFKVEQTGYSFYLMKQDILTFVSQYRFLDLIKKKEKDLKDKELATWKLANEFYKYYELMEFSDTTLHKYLCDVECGYIEKEEQKKQFVLIDFDGIPE